MMTDGNRYRGISETVHEIGYAILVFHQGVICKQMQWQTVACINVNFFQENIMGNGYRVDATVIAVADKRIGPAFIKHLTADGAVAFLKQCAIKLCRVIYSLVGDTVNDLVNSFFTAPEQPYHI